MTETVFQSESVVFILNDMSLLFFQAEQSIQYCKIQPELPFFISKY